MVVNKLEYFVQVIDSNVNFLGPNMNLSTALNSVPARRRVDGEDDVGGRGRDVSVDVVSMVRVAV